ncbi:MAG: hypothetical protein KDI19_15210, partial [Pseudomonadales bacterium]|nr:hypothetical protein [Pseudomonadales bacterium]
MMLGVTGILKRAIGRLYPMAFPAGPGDPMAAVVAVADDDDSPSRPSWYLPAAPMVKSVHARFLETVFGAEVSPVPAPTRSDQQLAAECVRQLQSADFRRKSIPRLPV